MPRIGPSLPSAPGPGAGGSAHTPLSPHPTRHAGASAAPGPASGHRHSETGGRVVAATARSLAENGLAARRRYRTSGTHQNPVARITRSISGNLSPVRGGDDTTGQSADSISDTPTRQARFHIASRRPSIRDDPPAIRFLPKPVYQLSGRTRHRHRRPSGGRYRTIPSTSVCPAWMCLANARPAAWFLAFTVSVGAPIRVHPSPRRSTILNASSGCMAISAQLRAVISFNATSQSCRLVNLSLITVSTKAVVNPGAVIPRPG